MTIQEQLKLENQLCFPLYAASRRITALYTPVLKPLRLTYTQYLVFLVLWEKDAQTVGDICRKLYLDCGTVTPLLKKMEEAGYITRTRRKDDERVVTVCLTEKGRDMQSCCADIPSRVGKCVNLKPQDAQLLYGLLYKMIGEAGND